MVTGTSRSPYWYVVSSINLVQSLSQSFSRAFVMGIPSEPMIQTDQQTIDVHASAKDTFFLDLFNKQTEMMLSKYLTNIRRLQTHLKTRF